QFRRTVNAALHAHSGITVLRINDFEWRGLAHPLDLGRIKLAANHTFHRIDGVRRIRHGLPLRNLPYEVLALISETDHTGCGASAFFVRHDLNGAAFEDRNAALRRTQVNPDNLSHVVTAGELLVLVCGHFHHRGPQQAIPDAIAAGNFFGH